MRKLTLFFILLLCIVTGAKAGIGEPLDRTNWKVSVSSWCLDGDKSDGGIGLINDDNTATYWHSNWGGDGQGAATGNLINAPEYFIVDLGESKSIGGFGYRSKSSGNGHVSDYKIYVSDTPFSLATPASNESDKAAAKDISADLLVASGTLALDRNAEHIIYPTIKSGVSGRYVLFVMLGSYGAKDDGSGDETDKWATCADFKVYEYTPSYATVVDDNKDVLKTGTNSSNHFTSFTLNGTTITIPSDKYNNVYKSLTNDWNRVFHVTAGSTYAITHTGNWASAMHGYAFVDFGNDGVFNAAGSSGTVTDDTDILAYTFYGNKKWGKGHDATTTSGITEGRLNNNNGNDPFPDCTMPSTMLPGFYRMRINVTWNNVSPAGAIGNGGEIIDLRLHVKGTETSLAVKSATNCTVKQSDGTTDLSTATITTGEPYTIKVVPTEGYALNQMTIKYGYITNPVNKDLLGDMPNWTTLVVTAEDFSEDGTYTLPADITQYGEVEITAECVSESSYFDATVEHIYRTAAGDKVLKSETISVVAGRTIEADETVVTSEFLHLVGETTLTVEEGKTEYVFYIEEQNIPFQSSASFETAKWYAVHSTSDPGTNYSVENHWKYDATNNVTIPTTRGNGDEYLWAFVGNVIDGYKIYNKAAGASLTLYKSATGNVESNMSSATSNNVFDISVGINNGTTDQTIAFKLKVEGEGFYLNPQSTELRGWAKNGAPDAGSSWDFTAAYSVNLNASGIEGVGNLATFSAAVATAVPAGTKAYFAAVSNDLVVLTPLEEGKAIPANQGVILESESDNISMYATSAEVADATDNALLHTADGAKLYTDLPENSYMLAPKGGEAAFCKILKGKLGANKAYIVIDNATQNAVRMFFGDMETGIESLPTEQETKDAPVYDLSGRRVLNPVKGGIYVSKGKKFIVK